MQASLQDKFSGSLLGAMIGGATNVHHTQAVPTLGFEAGLSWTPSPAWGWRRFTFCYVFEHWWDLGNAAGSRAELTAQGIFFRGEFGY